jgi:flagellar basal body-associated protein FliL
MNSDEEYKQMHERNGAHCKKNKSSKLVSIFIYIIYLILFLLIGVGIVFYVKSKNIENEIAKLDSKSNTFENDKKALLAKKNKYSNLSGGFIITPSVLLVIRIIIWFIGNDPRSCM